MFEFCMVKVMLQDITDAYPFGDELFLVKMDGKTLMKMLEWSVHDSLTPTMTAHGGSFLQISGVKVTTIRTLKYIHCVNKTWH